MRYWSLWSHKLSFFPLRQTSYSTRCDCLHMLALTDSRTGPGGEAFPRRVALSTPCRWSANVARRLCRWIHLPWKARYSDHMVASRTQAVITVTMVFYAPSFCFFAGVDGIFAAKRIKDTLSRTIWAEQETRKNTQMRNFAEKIIPEEKLL